MSKLRVTVEWMFKEIKLFWSATDEKRKMRVGLFPVGIFYMGAMLMMNIRNCLHPNQLSQFFDLEPPSLKEYLYHKDE